MRRRGPILFVAVSLIVFVVGAMAWRVSIYLSAPGKRSDSPVISAPAPVDKGAQLELLTPLSPKEKESSNVEESSKVKVADALPTPPRSPEDPALEGPAPAKLETRVRRRRKPSVISSPEGLSEEESKLLHPLVRAPVEPDEAIRMAIRDAKPVLEHCYEKELKKQAIFNGFLVVNLSVTASGRVTQATVDQTTAKEAQVAACIAAKLKRLKLPTLTTDAEVSVPIKLEARGL